MEAANQVEVVILKHGTPFGEPGSRHRISKETADHLCQIRKEDLGGGQLREYRVAKPADEKEPPIPISALSQGEAAAIGVKNIVETPPDTILPKGAAGMPLPGDPDYDPALGVNQKPRGADKASEAPKKLTKRQQAAADKREAKAAAKGVASAKTTETDPPSTEDEEEGSEDETETEGNTTET